MSNDPMDLAGVLRVLEVAAKRLRMPDANGLPAGPITAAECDAARATIARLAERTEPPVAWRLLEVGEVLQSGDGVWDSGSLPARWVEAGALGYEGDAVDRNDNPCRRRYTPAPPSPDALVTALRGLPRYDVWDAGDNDLRHGKEAAGMWIKADELDRIIAAHEGQQHTQEGGKP